MVDIHNRRRTDVRYGVCADRDKNQNASINHLHGPRALDKETGDAQTDEEDCVRILIIFKQSIFRYALASLLNEQSDLKVVGTAGNCEECVRKAMQLSPDVLLCDMDSVCSISSEIDSVGCYSFEVLRDALPDVPVIALQDEESDYQILGASMNGIRGFVTTNTRREDLFKAIRVVKDGSTFLARGLQSRVLDMLNQLNKGEKIEEYLLNDRERKILFLLAQGKRNQEIADEVYLSVSSVKRYINTLCSKLGATNRAEAVRIGISKHLIPAG